MTSGEAPRVLQIGSSGNGFGSPKGLRVRFGTETNWTWRKPTKEEYETMLSAFAPPAETKRSQADREYDWEIGRQLGRRDAEIGRLLAKVEELGQLVDKWRHVASTLRAAVVLAMPPQCECGICTGLRTVMDAMDAEK